MRCANDEGIFASNHHFTPDRLAPISVPRLLPSPSPAMSMVSHFMANYAASGNMSSASETGSLSGYASRMAYPKSQFQVHIDNHFSSKVYTTGSALSGNVTITTQRDVRFDSIQILLMGTSRTRVDGMGTPAESTHTFLKLAMPIPEASYPVPRILETGRTYTIPFNFVVPQHLTIGACNHHVKSDLVHDQHIRLPPTMGFWERDDMSPEMAKIEYAVKARVFRQPELEGNPIKVMEAAQQIRILPASAEDPPLGITKHDREYRMSKSKTIRKNLLGKLGKVFATACQPEAVSLRSDGLAISSTNAQVQLEFTPAGPGIPPPKVTAVSAKVAAHTYFAAGGIPSLPNLGDWNRSFAVERRGSYFTSVSLFSQSVDKFKWMQHIESQARRDSGYSSDHSASGEETGRRRKSKSSTSPIYHTATLQVPIQLPLPKRTFIPTFHSCIASRAYVLHLSVTLGSGSSSSTISLQVPLQVAVDLELQDQGGLPSFESAVEEAEADEYLRPRVLSVPEAQYLSTSVLPGYGGGAAPVAGQQVTAW